MIKSELPAGAIAAPLCEALNQSRCVVVTAPPGAGKSTLLPLCLLESLAPDEKLLLLEPRRIAARHIAARMANLLGEQTGQTVGYRVRKDTCVSKSTRLEVLTEGILTRMLIADPALEGVKIVVFDELHERNLNTDEALALARETQRLLRDDLKIVVMSATIDAERICKALDAPLLESQGRMFPVQIVRAEEPDRQHIAESVAHVIRMAHKQEDGDILAFLPGEWEIARTQELLGQALGDTAILPLFGRLSPQEQRKAIAPSAEGQRKVVLATPVAETSLTIEGIRIVVDSGYCKKPVYDPARGLSRLETVRISMDMADQRAGRAGRVAPGTCYRLWTAATESRMEPMRHPEIEDADLTGLVLDTAAFGADIQSLPWLTPPPAGNIYKGRELLRMLDAIDDHGLITETGKLLNRMPCHPRLGHMMLQVRNEDEKRLAEQLTDTLEGLSRKPIPETYAAGRLLAAAYPERIMKKGEDWSVAAEMAGERVVTAAPLHVDDLQPYIRTREVVRWDVKQHTLVAQTENRVGTCLLSARPLPNPTESLVNEAIALAAQKDFLSMFDFSDGVRRLQQRLRCLQEWHPEIGLPESDDAALMADIRDWLPMYLPKQGAPRLDQIKIEEVIWGRLSYEQQQLADRLTPSHLTVPTGSKIRIDYRQGAELPIVSVRLQECFGLTDTPRVDDGKRPVLMELLSPGFKPVQLTSDLRSFWTNTYFEVRKELKRRYPKHSWPDNPLEADPVRGVKKKT